MSVSGTSQFQGKQVNDGLSKRDQMKLEKAIKRFESQDNQQIRHPKRRAHNSLAANEPNQRKQIKIDNYSGPHDSVMSSPLNSNEQASTTPPQPIHEVKQLPNHFNSAYDLPEGQQAIFNYLMCYTYTEGQKAMEREGQSWSKIDQIGIKSVSLLGGDASAKLCEKLDVKYREIKERLRQPLSKTHRQFNQKFLKKQFLME